ncbi:hypothetical protein Asppvi_010751 [Aspergillus pseudoviridinutans]|uniref:Uncharacterized protein n=1 Tax=Aspergillus pseudoviridinutans TaxID=1517512 RepID=A0A9P3F087_9EURO|nr:uncharacterized protein Asppvi_010751 [Aspergillus pseudoviridinutans]GIJ91778.1 hypothetical protein Asppvi_010751 [Aspergillus pseudoviridinutans]
MGKRERAQLATGSDHSSPKSPTLATEFETSRSDQARPPDSIPCQTSVAPAGQLRFEPVLPASTPTRAAAPVVVVPEHDQTAAPATQLEQPQSTGDHGHTSWTINSAEQVSQPLDQIARQALAILDQ